mmetsp:Transcript_55307/g.144216  ORF Transcript_55307/g.144216 Transcript_55307/m.144216 type:complete len:279 (+) Transcript_55307:800-1636(+)
MSFLQSSHLAYSSFCCLFNSASILSIATFTSVKASKRTRTANDTKDQFLCFRATFAILCMALSTAWSWTATCSDVATCKKVGGFSPALVLPNRSRASSSLRMVKVSLSATISSVRTLTRALYCASSCWQSFCMLARNSWSASMAAVVSSLSSLALAAFSNVSASSASLVSFRSVATSISESFAAFKFWKSTSAMKSVFCASDKSLENSSLISARSPRMPPLRELYDFAFAAAPSKSFALASLPTCSSVFSHGSNSRGRFVCSKDATARFGKKASWRWT